MAKYEVKLIGGEHGTFDRLSERAIEGYIVDLEPEYRSAVGEANKLGMLRGYKLPEPKLIIGNYGNADNSFRGSNLKTELGCNLGNNISVKMILQSHRHLIGKRVMVKSEIEASMTVKGPGDGDMVVDFRLGYANGRRESVRLGGRLYSGYNLLRDLDYGWDCCNGGQPSQVIIGLGIDVAQGKFNYDISRQGFEVFWGYLRKIGLKSLGGD